MQIQVNGERRTAADGMTIADLLRELDIRPDRVAVEVNLEIVDKQDFGRRGIREGDRVEILSFIGGGRTEPSAISRQVSGEEWRSGTGSGPGEAES